MKQEQLNLLKAASQIRSGEEALAFWAAYENRLEKSALILGVPGNLGFRVPLRGTLGRNARLLSLFADDGVFVLDKEIYREMFKGHQPQIPLEYVISFDTNTASYFRSFFRGRISRIHDDILCLLRHFQVRLNFDIFPYLCENAHRFTNVCPQEVFETVIATHRLADLDATAFTATGELRTKSSPEAIHKAAEKEVEDFTRLLGKGWDKELERRRAPVRAIILKMALLELEWPGRSNAIRKLRGLIEFMDKELNTLFLLLTIPAWEWFMDSDRATIFRKLQRNAPDLLKEVRNISWDIYHMLQVRERAIVPTPRATYVLPYFLTFDQGLADLFELCALRNCLIEERGEFPVSFPKQDMEDWLAVVFAEDPEFKHAHFGAEAYAKRDSARNSDGRTDCTMLIEELERVLVRRQRTA